MNQLTKAYLYALIFHDGQVDKAGIDYILHPMRVSSKMETETEKIVALLHDTVEDTPATVEQIQSLFGEEVAAAVAAMTKGEEEDYKDYIARLSKNPIAVKVKLADLEHNMSIERLPSFTEKGKERVAKYRWARDFLSQKL